MVKRKHLVIISIVFAVLLIIGSFVDLNIAKGMYFPRNVFSVAVASFGTLITFSLCMFVSGIVTVNTYKNKTLNKYLKILTYLAFLGMLILSTYMCGNDIFCISGLNRPDLNILGFVIAFIVLLGFGVLGGFLFRKMEVLPNIWMPFVVLAISVAICTAIGMCIKLLMHRPRFRWLIEDSGSIEGFFHNWWQPFKEYERFITGDVTKDEFEAFPSGHALFSSFAMIFVPFLTYLTGRSKKYITKGFYIGFGWVIVVCFSRLIAGDHFLSDVSMAALIVCILFIIANEIIWKYKGFENDKKEEKKLSEENGK